MASAEKCTQDRLAVLVAERDYARAVLQRERVRADELTQALVTIALGRCHCEFANPAECWPCLAQAALREHAHEAA